jgi:cytochrome P450/GT2 family glycosyltransferase
MTSTLTKRGTMTEPGLWVVVPAYNEEAAVGATLAALAAQTDRDFVLVVVDNASTDATAAVVGRFAVTAPFPVRVVVEPSPGAGTAADTGFRYALAHGATLLARTDADCRPAPDWVAAARAALAGGAEMACGRSVPRRDERPTLGERYVLPVIVSAAAVYARYRSEHRDPRFRSPYVLCSGHNIAITADLYRRCGGTVREPLAARSEDMALLNRAREHSDRIVRVPAMVVETSLRRLRAWGYRRTLLWYWDRRYRPVDDAAVHVRGAVGGPAVSGGRRRDRRVYLASHPGIFALLAATRGRAVRRLGGMLVVHGSAAHREALTQIPLDRTADGTIGAEAHRLLAAGVLFNQDGRDHRDARRTIADDLGAHGVDRLRPVWMEVLDRRLKPLRDGGTVDIVDVAAELSGATAGAMLGLDADPHAVAGAARNLAAASIRTQLGLWRSRHRAAQAAAAERLSAVLREAPLCADPAGAGLAAMLTVAAVTTTTAGLPRAVAWCADDGLWDQALETDKRAALGSELLRVVSPVPVMLRVAAAAGEVGGCPVRAGDRMLLVTRHAVDAHRTGPDPSRPALAQVAQIVFGVGTHACPGARLARAQLDDTLRLLAPLRPVVRRARADRHSALPGWGRLLIAAGDAR